MMEPAALIDGCVLSALLIALGLVLTVGGRTGDVSQQRAGLFLSIGGIALALVTAGVWQHSSTGETAAAALLVVSFGVLLPTRRSPPQDAALAELEDRQ